MTESLDDTWPERAQGQLYEWLHTQPTRIAALPSSDTVACYDDPDSWQMHPDKLITEQFIAAVAAGKDVRVPRGGPSLKRAPTRS